MAQQEGKGGLEVQGGGNMDSRLLYAFILYFYSPSDIIDELNLIKFFAQTNCIIIGMFRRNMTKQEIILREDVI